MSDDVEKPEPLEEPSVLDYVKSLFRFRNGKPIQIPMEQTLPPEQVEKKQSLLEITPQLQPLDNVQREPLLVETPRLIFSWLLNPWKKNLSLPFPGVPCWHSCWRGSLNEPSNRRTLLLKSDLPFILLRFPCWAGPCTAANGNSLLMRQPLPGPIRLPTADCR